MNGKLLFSIVLAMGLLISSTADAVLFQRRPTVAKLRKKINKMPTDSKSKTKAILYSELGTLLYKKGQFREGSTELNNALKHKTSPKLRRHIYLFLGKCYESYGDVPRSITAYEKAVEYDRRNWKRHRDLARVYEVSRQLKNARFSLEKAVTYNPKEGTLYFSLGRIWRQEQMLLLAEAYLNQAKKFGVEGRDWSREMSLVYEGQSRFNESLLIFEKGLSEKSPARDWARFIYLAVLANNRAFANRGVDALQKQNVSIDTLATYETLAQVAGKSIDEILMQSESDAFIKQLLDSVSEPDIEDLIENEEELEEVVE